MSSRSMVWDYFQRMGDKSKCCLCNKLISTRKNTSNLHSHLKYKHPLKYFALQENLRKNRNEEDKSDTGESESTDCR